jgi:hypothetical protein
MQTSKSCEVSRFAITSAEQQCPYKITKMKNKIRTVDTHSIVLIIPAWTAREYTSPLGRYPVFTRLNCHCILGSFFLAATCDVLWPVYAKNIKVSFQYALSRTEEEENNRGTTPWQLASHARDTAIRRSWWVCSLVGGSAEPRQETIRLGVG